MNTISIAGGGVAGRAHRRAGRGAQDAFAWVHARGGAAAVAVVCDGCGSAPHSEVGATLGARLWTRALAGRLDAGFELDDEALWSAARDEVLARLGELARAMGDDLERTVRDHFLFTSVVAAWTARGLAVRAIGDGVVAFDRDVRVLGPFADNQPPYLGYGIGGEVPPWSACFVRDPDETNAIVIASDGAAALDDPALRDAAGEPLGGLAAIAADRRWFANPDALRRRLAVINREELIYDHARGAVERRGAPLDDDTTIVVLRKERAS